MENITRRSFSLNLTVLRLVGLYPRKQPSVLYLVYGYVLLIFCMLPDPVLGFLYYLKHEELSIMDGGFNNFILMGMLCYIPKVLPFIADHESIRECLHYLETLTSVRLNERQKIIVAESVWVCKRNSIFFFVCILLDVITWSCRPLLLSQKKLPLDVWLPFDSTSNALRFCSIYVFVAMGATYLAMVSAVIDPLIAGMAYLATGQIKVLKDKLQFLYEDDQPSELIYERIQQCIQHHHAIIRFVKQIERCFSWSILYQFVGSTGVICFSCLELSKMELLSVNSLLMTTYVSSLTLEIYFYCYYGTTIFEESKGLVTAAYMGPWYNYDLKSQKALVVFMERAKIPMGVTVGKVFYMNLDSFTEIWKKSYSLLAVLRNY